MENYGHLKYWEWQIDADCVDIYLPENIVSIMIIIVFKLKQIIDVVYSLSE